MKIARRLRIAVIGCAIAASVMASGSAHAHVPNATGWITGFSVTNTLHTLTIADGFVNGGGFPTIITLDSVPMFTECVRVLDSSSETIWGVGHEYHVKAFDPIAGAFVFVNIIDYELPGGDRFGAGYLPDLGNCYADVTALPLATGSPQFTTT